jgi:hypothetical protein
MASVSGVIKAFVPYTNLQTQGFDPQAANMDQPSTGGNEDMKRYCGGIEWMCRRSARSSRQQNE